MTKKLSIKEENSLLRSALERISAIEDEMQGADWAEIEEARRIADEALAGRPLPPPVGKWISVFSRLPDENETLDGRVAALDVDGVPVMAVVLPDQLISTGVEVAYWMALPPL